MIKKASEIIGTVLTFLTSTGFSYFGVLGAAFAIWSVASKTLGWIGWILVGYFICHNMNLIRPWALKQYEDIKKKF